MKQEHKELIHDYLNLDSRIKRTEKRRYQAEYSFNMQTFCGTTDFSSPLGIRHKGFRVDVRVVEHIDLMNTYKLNTKKNRRRQYHFNRFMYSLDPHTRASLERRYKQVSNYDDIQALGHDHVVLDEILEIEEAIGYEFNTSMIDDDEGDAMKVEYTRFTTDTVEDSFQAMQAMLGV